MKKIIWVIFGIAILILFYYWKNPLSAKVKIRDTVFFVDLAVTSKERERGLSGRASLAKNQGMLFLFGSPGVYHFWMRGMKFPLDFIWIRENKIVDISKNIPPPRNSEPPTEIAPLLPVDKVLEVNAGTIEKIGIKVGDTLEFPN